MKIVHESERVAKLRTIIKSLDTKELEFLQEYIEREREDRRRYVFSEWKNYLGTFFCKQLH